MKIQLEINIDIPKQLKKKIKKENMVETFKEFLKDEVRCIDYGEYLLEIKSVKELKCFLDLKEKK